MPKLYNLLILLFFSNSIYAQTVDTAHYLVRKEIITPMRKTSFMTHNDTTCRERKQDGNPRQINGYQVFDGSMDGNLYPFQGEILRGNKGFKIQFF